MVAIHILSVQCYLNSCKSCEAMADTQQLVILRAYIFFSSEFDRYSDRMMKVVSL